MKNLSSATRVGELFGRRWLDHVQHQIGALRSVVDGVILLYMGIPGLLLLSRVYYVLMVGELPDWLTRVPLIVVPILLFVLTMLLGGLVLLLEAADVLFLKHHPEWLRGMMRRAILLGLVKRLVVMLLGIALLAPVLYRVFGMGWSDILLFYALTAAMNAAALPLFNLLAVALSGFRRMLLRGMAGGLLGASYIASVLNMADWPNLLLITLVCYIVICAWSIRSRLHIQGRFEAEIREEERQRTRLTGMLLQSAVDHPARTRPRPWLFRRSGHILRKRQVYDRVTEATVKSYFRSREVSLYIQFAIYGSIAVYLPPYPVNLLVYIALVVLLFQWMNTNRRVFYQTKLLAILPKDENLEFICAPATMRLLLFPAILIVSAGLCINLFTLGWGLLLAIPLAAAVSLLAVPVLWRFFSMSSRRRKL